MTLTDTEAPPLPATKRSAWREVPFLVVLAIVLALVIKALLVQAFSIPSGSMENTLGIGDRVLVNKVVYDVRGIHRGEIVVFKNDEWEPEGEPVHRGTLSSGVHHVAVFFGLASDDKDYIKRVIGLPGDRVMCCSPSGDVVVTPAGGAPVELHEPYLDQTGDDDRTPSTDPARYFCAAGGGGNAGSNGQQLCPPGAQGILVPPGRLFVLGDHRPVSADSRYHLTDGHSGTITESSVVGRAFVVIYPVNHWRVLSVPSTFTSALSLPGANLGLGAAGALPVTLVRRRLRGRRT